MKFKRVLPILIAYSLGMTTLAGCGETTPEAQQTAEDNTTDGSGTGSADPYIRGGNVSTYYQEPEAEDSDATTDAEVPANTPVSDPVVSSEAAGATITPSPSASEVPEEKKAPVRVDHDLYVSTYGNDNSDGTYENPLLTLQQAIDMVNPGYTIYVMSGIYRGANTFNISGTADKPITITHLPGADASSVMISLGYGEEGAIFDMNGQSNIRLIDLRLGNSVANWVYGIYMPKGTNNIWIEENEFIDLCAPDIGAAYGILMYGDGDKFDDSIHDIYIYDNEIHSIITGQGMGVAGSGNLNTITIDGNHLYNITNHGIDIYGGGRTSFDDALDQPYDIIIRGNTVHHINVYNDLSCSGILVDGTRDTTVNDNYVYESPCGIEVCSENYNYDYPTNNISVTNNTVHDNHDTGISIGGYNACYYGTVQNINVSNNMLYNNGYKANDGANGEMHFEKCNGVMVSNNLVRNHDYAYPVIGCGKTSEYVKNVVFDNNVYAYDKPEKMIFRYQGNVYIGLDNWNKVTGGSDTNATSTKTK